jgi:hypothetical protein
VTGEVKAAVEVKVKAVKIEVKALNIDYSYTDLLGVIFVVFFWLLFKRTKV